MKYDKVEKLLDSFVAEKKMNKADAEKLKKELERVLDETVSKMKKREGGR